MIVTQQARNNLFGLKFLTIQFSIWIMIVTQNQMNLFGLGLGFLVIHITLRSPMYVRRAVDKRARIIFHIHCELVRGRWTKKKWMDEK
jgi:hypothetical protein